MKRLSISSALCVCLLSTSMVFGADPPGKAGQEGTPKDDSPKDVLVHLSQACDKADFDAAEKFYDESKATPLEKEMNHSYLKYAIEITRIEHAMRQKYGTDAAEEFDHAINETSDADVAKGNFKIDGDRAIFKFATPVGDDLPFIRVKGQWKLDLHAAVKDQSEADLKASIKLTNGAAPRAAPIAEKIKRGDYKNPADAIADFTKIVDSFSEPKPEK